MNLIRIMSDIRARRDGQARLRPRIGRKSASSALLNDSVDPTRLDTHCYRARVAPVVPLTMHYQHHYDYYVVYPAAAEVAKNQINGGARVLEANTRSSAIYRYRSTTVIYTTMAMKISSFLSFWYCHRSGQW